MAVFDILKLNEKKNPLRRVIVRGDRSEGLARMPEVNRLIFGVNLAMKDMPGPYAINRRYSDGSSIDILFAQGREIVTITVPPRKVVEDFEYTPAYVAYTFDGAIYRKAGYFLAYPKTLEPYGNILSENDIEILDGKEYALCVHPYTIDPPAYLAYDTVTEEWVYDLPYSYQNVWTEVSDITYTIHDWDDPNPGDKYLIWFEKYGYYTSSFVYPGSVIGPYVVNHHETGETDNFYNGNSTNPAFPGERDTQIGTALRLAGNCALYKDEDRFSFWYTRTTYEYGSEGFPPVYHYDVSDLKLILNIAGAEYVISDMEYSLDNLNLDSWTKYHHLERTGSWMYPLTNRTIYLGSIPVEIDTLVGGVITGSDFAMFYYFKDQQEVPVKKKFTDSPGTGNVEGDTMRVHPIKDGYFGIGEIIMARAKTDD